MKTIFIISSADSIFRAERNRGPAVVLLGVADPFVNDVKAAIALMTKAPVVTIVFTPDRIKIDLLSTYYTFPSSNRVELIKTIGDLIGWSPLTDEERRQYAAANVTSISDEEFLFWESATILKPTDASKIKLLSDNPIIGVGEVAGLLQLIPVTIGELYPI